MTAEQIKKIGDRHHKDMVKMGWSKPEKSDDHYIMLTVCEICEAIQAHRKGHVITSSPVPNEYVEAYADNLHTPDALFKHTFEYYCKDTTMDEFADVMLRLLSLAWMRGWEVELKEMTILEGMSFTEYAMELVDILRSGYNEYAVSKAISFLLAWADMLNIDMFKACTRKMRYNRLRSDWKNKEKAY